MAKTQRRAEAVEQGERRVKTVSGRRAAAKKSSQPVKKVEVTLGDLIAAAFDVTGESEGVAKLMGSRAMARATGRQIVVEG